MACALTLLVVSQGEPCVLPLVSDLRVKAGLMQAEWLLVADGYPAWERLDQAHLLPQFIVHSEGYLESVFDEAISHCRGTDILRLDDDESIGPDFVQWINGKAYLAAAQWRFARQHLWGSDREYLTTAPLYPDYQTRLSVASLAGNRTTIHAASPYGKGRVAPVQIQHHKFLIRDRAEREAQADHYERIRPGAGRGKFLPYVLPEAAFSELTVQTVGS